MTVETWTHGFAGVERGVRLHFVEQGDGPLVLLLHGFPEFWYSWREQIPALAAAGYHVVAPDLRGYNDSDKPAGVRAYRLERLVADVRALMAHFDAEKATIVGHDWGGAIAWQFAIDCPEATERLIVLNAPHPGAAAKNLWRGGWPNLRQLRRSWYVLFFQIPWLPERALARNGYRFIERAFRENDAARSTFSDEDIARFKQAIAKPGALSAGINYYRAALRYPPAGSPFRRRGSVPKIAAETLLIWGERDPYLGRELTEGMDEFFDGRFTVRYIPEASHWVQQEDPQRCNEYITEFLRGNA